MLQIREPIHTVLDSELLHSQAAFTERIIGNYMQIGHNLSEADLLHVVTQPPEIFIVGGGESNIMNAANIENTQIQKVNIINNLVNRIMMSADAELTYQDTVYITNILHKLGIRDERKFMKEVYRLTEETKVRNEMVGYYWNHMNELRLVVQEYTEQMNLSRQTMENQLQENVLYLHKEVNQRLQTAGIYRVMQNFYESTEGAHSVTNEEYRIAEQRRLSQVMLLDRLREVVRGEELPLVYRHDNIYEGDETDVTNVTMEQVNERITSAVLLNLVDNLYEMTYDRIDHQVKNWISTEAAYYGAAENTLYRIEENTAYLQYLHEETRNLGDSLDSYMSEMNLLHHMTNYYESADIRLQQSIGGNLYENETVENRYAGDAYFEHHTDQHEAADLTHLHIDGDQEVVDVTQVDQTELTEQVDRSEIRNMIQETLHQENQQSGDTNVSYQTNVHESADMTLLQQEETTEELNHTEEHRDEFTERVYQTYQQSIARNERYMQNLKTVLAQNKQEAPTQTPAERILSESRKALENPEAFMQSFREAEREIEDREQRIEADAEKLLTPEQQWAHELIREYMRLPERFYQSEIISRDNIGLLLRDIQEAEYEEQYGNRSEPETAGTDIYEAASETREGVSPVYPPSSDTTVRSLYPELPERIPEEAGHRYQSLTLQNLYPLYHNQMIFRDMDTDVERLASEVKEQLQQTGEQGSERSTGNAAGQGEEIIREAERRVEREFTTTYDRMTDSEQSTIIYRRDQEIVSTITDRVIERWQERKVRSPEPETMTENVNIAMVHRTSETTVDEEVIENLRQQIENIEETNKSTIRQVENRMSEERTVVNQVAEHTVVQNTEEIERLVNQNMRRQIDEISDRVYGKLERQLRNEQRRRGL